MRGSGRVTNGSFYRRSIISLSPSDAIEPYEVTLNKMGARDRKLWAETVLDQLRPHLAGVDEVVFLAGERYREHLEAAVQEGGCAVQVPMAKLSIGYQLQWLSRQLREAV